MKYRCKIRNARQTRMSYQFNNSLYVQKLIIKVLDSFGLLYMAENETVFEEFLIQSEAYLLNKFYFVKKLTKFITIDWATFTTKVNIFSTVFFTASATH